ncbi:MAG: class I SAM-dependent methyltransferase [Ktedonobacteraceae bacterium]|nr:class I SAM-dependent methyltransferase [Ktedonobacteraceae bacterium]
MSSEPSAQGEQPSTYFVQDRSSKVERERVTIQDQMITHGMGGVLPEQPDPTLFQRMLDVGCGTGSWLIEAATTYPTMKTLVGIDISTRMVEYARTFAEQQHVSDRVEFRVMDALRTIEFPAGSFDLVNQRMGWSYLRTWDWSNLLQEYRRVTRHEGIIRITESDAFRDTSSPALNQLCAIARDAFFRAGHLFIEGHEGVTSKLADLLHQQGLQNVQTRKVKIKYYAGSAAMESGKEDMRLLFRTMLPFLQKWTRVPKDYDQIYQQAVKDMNQPDYAADWEMVTAWGTNP